MFRKFERVYEKGVIYDPSVKEWREYDETL
jgi:hypothetical protein